MSKHRLIRVAAGVLLTFAAIPLALLAAESDVIHYLTTTGSPLAEGTTPGTFTYPRALAYDAAGRLYIGDDTGRIQIYGPDHNPRYQLDAPLHRFTPAGIAIDAAGKMLVSDSWNDKVMLFSAATDTTAPQQIAAVGESGDYDPLEPLDPSNPQYDPTWNDDDHWHEGPPPIDPLVTWGAWGLAIKAGTVLQNPADPAPASATGRVALVDNGNHRVVVLNSKLQPLYDFGGHPAGSDAPPGSFEYPQGIAIDSAGLFYVADTDNSRIQVFREVTDAQGNLHGEFVRMFGSLIEGGQFGASAGDVDHPQSLGFDAAGRLWITDSQRHRLLRVDVRQNIDPAGLTSCLGIIALAGNPPCSVATSDHQNYAAIAIGTRGQNPGAGANALFQAPGGVAANASEMAVADTGDHVVQIFDFPSLALAFEGSGSVQPDPHPVNVPFEFSASLANAGSLPLHVSLRPSASGADGEPFDGEFGGDMTADIQPQETHTFAMTFTPLQPGSVTLHVDASGQADVLFGGTVDAGTLPLNGGAVLPGVDVTMWTLSPLSATVGVGDTFLLSLEVRNTGLSPLTNVQPVVTIDQSSPIVSTDDVFGPFDLAALEHRPVTYLFHVNAAGTATLRPSVTASDDASGEPHTLEAAAKPVQLTLSNDLIAPTTTATTTPAQPSQFGWFNQPVTIHFAAVDNAGGSGVAATYYRVIEDNQAWTPLSSADLTVGFSAIKTIAFYSRDHAGNEEPQKTLVVKIDPNPPTMRASVITSVTPAVNGWYSSNPTITFNADENLSGIAQITAPIMITTEGANQTVTGFAIDQAGNRSQDTHVTVNVDKTPPALSCGVTGGGIVWPPNHKMATVNFTVTVSDAVSGVARYGPGGPTFKLLSATSNEPVNRAADGNTNVDLTGWSLGTADTSGQVRAERAGTGSGRVYTFVYEARDNAGNTGTCAISVAVPHDQGKK